MRVSRRSLIGTTMVSVAASTIAEASSPQPQGTEPTEHSSASFYLQLVKANNDAIPTLLKQLQSATLVRSGIRRVGEALETLAAAYCAPESSYFQSESLLAPMESASLSLVRAQHPDGTIDAGNLNSPPDTGFVLETVCTALAVLLRAKDPRLARAQENMRQFALAGGEALTTGGIHTPNHRWVVCAALARVHSLAPAAKYISRIDDWLGEGIYCDVDGQFSERSTGIYSQVIDNALITMARLLNRAQLLEPVRRNLDMNLYYTHPDGEVETVGSRRQDAGMVESIANYYLDYRYMAAKDRNGHYAGMVDLIERLQTARVKRANLLINFLEEPLLKIELPPAIPLPSSYAKIFGNSGLARVRRNAISATVFGGTDWPLGVASGLSSNTTFFTFRKGKAILESVRIGAQFFSEGAFRSEGLVVEGNQYHLHQPLDVPYYQPLPATERNARGDYRLTPVKDARYWSKMNFPLRPMSNVQSINQKVVIVENDGVFELRFDISGHSGVPYTIELGFRSGGKMEGQLQKHAENVYFLTQGVAKYGVGDDWIEFGPGQMEHEYVNLEGSSYLAHHGTLRPSGPCIYITGFTPFQKVITIRSA
jgi:hypothetical protein